MNGVWWQTVEHYYQAMKFTDAEYIEKIRITKTPKEAGNLGRNRNMKIRENWDEIKYEIMVEAVTKKFQTHKKLRAILLATGDSKLAENSPFDYYWGIGVDGSGLNMLGKILMKIREDLTKCVLNEKKDFG
jgi:ribA/ribD-fused uncharacterized protein